MKPKDVTTQMKALNEYFLMGVVMLLLNRLHVFTNFVSFEQRNMAVKELNTADIQSYVQDFRKL